MKKTQAEKLSSVPVILKRKTVQEITSLSTSTIYKLMSQGKFPRPVNLGNNRVGWVDSEVGAWVENRIAGRDMGASHE